MLPVPCVHSLTSLTSLAPHPRAPQHEQDAESVRPNHVAALFETRVARAKAVRRGQSADGRTVAGMLLNISVYIQSIFSVKVSLN